MTDVALEIDFWDVGQGDCSVIKLPNGKLLIIDVGPRGSALIEWLREGRRRSIQIESIILTHNDADHAGAMPALINEFKRQIGAVYMLVDRSKTDPKFEKIFRAVYEGEREGCYKILRAELGQILWSDSSTQASLRVVHPSFSQNVLATDPNDTSAVILLECGGRALNAWPGDLELRTSAQVLKDFRPWMMVGPHHGGPSDYPTKALRKKTEPRSLRNRMAEIRAAARDLNLSRSFISVGTKNQHSHPRPGYLRLLAGEATRVVCSQITFCCDRKRVLHRKPVFEGSGALGLRSPKSGVACRGAIRFYLRQGELVPDQFDQLHLARVSDLQRPQCLRVGGRRNPDFPPEFKS